MATDGGPAYPQAYNGQHIGGSPFMEVKGGMSMLDYFAGQALANEVVFKSRALDGEVATECYELAAAMLVERERRMNGDV